MFSTVGRPVKRDTDEVSVDELYEQIGQLKMELEWLKKKVGGPEARRSCSESQASTTADAVDGSGGDLSEASVISGIAVLYQLRRAMMRGGFPTTHDLRFRGRPTGGRSPFP